MTPDSLKKIISWIATHGIKAYSAKTIEQDLNISLDESLHSASSVISEVLHSAFNSAKLTTGIQYSKSADDFFDLLLTALENLSEYKSDFQRLFDRDNMDFKTFDLAPVLNEITHTILSSKIETFLDKITYNIIICNILYTWTSDETVDLSPTLTKINHISQTIFTPS